MKFLDVPQSGSIAGTTHSHNRAGQYTRNRRSPVQPIGTGRRGFIRAAFGASSAAWSDLSDAERAAWGSFADAHPVTDSLGQSIILTGHQMFVRVNTTRQNVSLAVDANPPTVLTLPSVSGAGITLDVSSGISISGFTGDADSFVAVAFSAPMSPGRSFNKTFWQPPSSDGFTAGDAAPFTLITAKYAAQFGTPIPGQRTFVRITPISDDGWNGTPFITSSIWVA